MPDETPTVPAMPPEAPGMPAMAFPEGALGPPPAMPGVPGPGMPGGQPPPVPTALEPVPAPGYAAPVADSATASPPVAVIRESGIADSGTQEPAAPVPTPEPAPIPESALAFPPGIVMEVDPANLPIHPYADLLPLMSEAEYRGLRDAIALDGQQVPAQVYMGQLLDGRNRRRACQELGIPLKVEQFAGTDQTALVYVLSVNQHRRELSKSQRAAVAVQLLPFISADVQAKRSARITATQRRKRTGEIMSRVAGSPPGASSEPALTRSVAADRMERLARTRRLSVHRRERRERRESLPAHPRA